MNIRLSIVVLAIPLAACGNRSGESSAPAESPPSAEQPQTGVPSVEPTGPEKPATGGGKDVSINLPPLPVGGGGDSQDVHQCVSVAWKGNDIPSGVAVTVKDVQISPGSAFQRDKGGCGGHKECAASFTFRSSSDTCSVRVTAKGTDGSAKLLVIGACPPAQMRKCRDLGTGNIDLFQPSGPTTEETSTSQ